MLVAAFLVMALVPMTVQADDDTESSSVTIDVSGSLVLQTGVKQMYTVTAAGGPGNTTGGNYTWSVTLGGDYKDEATLKPSLGTSTTGVFFFNITAPESAGKLTATIVVKSVNKTENESVTKKITINVRDPVALTATIKNSANVTATSVPVYFYLADDSSSLEEIYNTTVDIEALGSKTILYNWTTYDLDSGSHKIKVVIDPESDYVTLNDGGKESTETFYYQVHGYGAVNSWLWVFVAILLVVLFFVYTRPQKRKKKKKKR